MKDFGPPNRDRPIAMAIRRHEPASPDGSRAIEGGSTNPTEPNDLAGHP
jgi:hypothetical protein